MLDDFDYAATISALDLERRLRFYEVFAMNMTVSVRSIWSNKETSDEQKVEQLKWLNEIMHRVTSKIQVLRLNTYEWTELDSWNDIKHWVARCPSLEGDIGWAIRRAYAVINHEHDDNR